MGQQLKNKTVTGIMWSFIDLMANQGIQFIIMIILARLLAPENFGLLGMVIIFISLSQTLIDSGFSQALIREKNVKRIDYSTVFIFNMLFSIIIFILIYCLAPFVSDFYNEPKLTSILRVISLIVFFQALSIIPRTILTKQMDFKSQTKVSLVSSITSGLLAIILAATGFGIWALVIRIVSQKILETIMLIYINKWRPVFEFSRKSFTKYFGFGWKLLLSSLIDTTYNNIYYVIIGRIYTTRELGFYTNARQIRDAVNQGITKSIQRVTYPVMSSIRTEEERLKYGFKKIIKVTAFLFFPIMLGLAAISEQLLVMLMGEKWLPAVEYFQLLCIAAILFPMHAINLNILKVKGRSDLFLKLEVIKKVMTTIALIITIILDLGVSSFIVTAIITSHLGLFINTYYSGKLINYGSIEQVKDLLPAYILSFFMGILVFFIGLKIDSYFIVIIIVQVIVGMIIYGGLSKLFRIKELEEILNLLKPLIADVKKRRK